MNIEALKRHFAPAVCNFLARSRLYKTAAPIFGGMGSILNFHHVLPPDTRQRVPSVRGLAVTPQWIENSIRFFRARGIEIISLDTMLDILQGRIAPRRFVVYTFDDGYEDNFTYGYPAFRRHNAPFTVYFISSFPDRQFIPWWLLLEDLILRNATLRFDWQGRMFSCNCSHEIGREAAFYELRSAVLESFRGPDPEGGLRALFAPFGIDIHTHSDIGMSWAQVRQLAADPLVTIGSHTVRHYPLAKISDQDLHYELAESRKSIEAKLQKEVRHFAFPYGSAGEATEREFAAIPVAGYETAVTTRPANIFAEHREHLHCLPRNLISGEREGRDPNLLNLWVSGTIPALENGFRRVVTV